MVLTKRLEKTPKISRHVAVSKAPSLKFKINSACVMDLRKSGYAVSTEM
jgi:hypothetical protein